MSAPWVQKLVGYGQARRNRDLYPFDTSVTLVSLFIAVVHTEVVEQFSVLLLRYETHRSPHPLLGLYSQATGRLLGSSYEVCSHN